MAYSELIKDFGRIRSYMRQFYVYGFKSRDEYDTKSARSYDNERRRVESWLGEYMSFRRNAEGKQVFLSVDSRAIPENPFYKAFKAKSFTDKDITLHFYILDALADGQPKSVKALAGQIEADYLSHFPDAFTVDESTLRKKLQEYCELGLLTKEKSGRDVLYVLAPDAVDLPEWQEAVAFFTEESPLGVVGSTLRDKADPAPDCLSFKHHYLLHALDSEVLCALFEAMGEKRCVDMEVLTLRYGKERAYQTYPLRIYISAQSGREYLLCYLYKFRKPMFFRLDSIQKVTPGPVEKEAEKYEGYYEKFKENLWGVSTGAEHSLDHIEMTIRVGPDEGYILQRLEREKRVGTLELLDDRTVRFTADVYDAGELVPWLRTFIGRIVSLKCSNPYVEQSFFDDLAAMAALYEGGDGCGIS